MHEYVLPCTQTYHVRFFYGHGSKAMEHVRHNNEAKCMGHLNHGLKTMDCVLQQKNTIKTNNEWVTKDEYQSMEA